MVRIAQEMARSGPRGPARWVVGVDLGGTKLAAVLIDDRRRIRHRVWYEHRAVDYPTALAAVTAAIRECARPADGTEVVVHGVGVAVAGPLDLNRARVLAALNLGFADQPMRHDLAEAVGVPVVLENDANAAAVAEHRAGSGAGARGMVLLTLGTGVGGGIVLDGSLVVGANGAAAELGHLSVEPGGRPCGCGGQGCLEQYASGSAVAADAARAVRAGTAPALAAYVQDASGPITARQVVAAADRGDPVATALLTDAGVHIGRAMAMLGPVIDPDVLVLGGGLAHSAAAHLIPSIRSTLARCRPFRCQSAPADIRLAACGPESGAIGAAELARDMLKMGKMGG